MQQDWRPYHRWVGGAYMVAVELYIILRTWVCVLNKIHYSSFSASSDTHYRALYTISSPWLGITLVSDRALVSYEYPVKNNILFGKQRATQNVLPCIMSCITVFNQPTNPTPPYYLVWPDLSRGTELVLCIVP